MTNLKRLTPLAALGRPRILAWPHPRMLSISAAELEFFSTALLQVRAAEPDDPHSLKMRNGGFYVSTRTHGLECGFLFAPRST